MSVSGDDFLNSAADFLSNEREIDYRNFISRGYYGMYHKISAILECNPKVSISHHSALIEYLGTPSQHKNEPFDSNKLKSLSYILKQERLMRNKADYDINDTDITLLDVDQSKRTHDQFRSRINELLNR
ncbi:MULTISPECIES: hypothetical protein [unclassified Gilliamella]|uniref:hypothetical protein n=1 Tax=unclassified Gilliamella TaxID=2685620 RepID=UPI0013089CC4|nr:MULTISPECIES: hypothetical protein [unclassified Gilliamella]MWP50433.1 hypothetical protein [Gilliamella sp. Lep-s35]MWP70161.1 hypothetical protein [Gilliamella sp. Lep-s5]MWP78379.1 hypothetical protein [Gilliamella sp. Lep-s21]